MEGLSSAIHVPLEQQFSCGDQMKNFFHHHFEKFPLEKSFSFDKSTVSFELIKSLMNHAAEIWNILKKRTNQMNPCLGDMLMYTLSLEDCLKNYLYKIDQVVQGVLINRMVTKDVVDSIEFNWKEGTSFEKKAAAKPFYVQFTTDDIAQFMDVYKESKVATISRLHVLSEVDIETIKVRIKAIPIPVLFMRITFLKDCKENIIVDSIKLRF